MKFARELLLAVVVSACSSTGLVQVPPRMVLDREQTIGIVAFEVRGGEAEAPAVSSRFLEAIQEGQPGVAVVELGSAAEVLRTIGKTHMDSEAVREIGKKFELDAVIVGVFTMEESEPEVDLDIDRGLDLGSLRAQVRLDASLEAKLVSTERGATLWTGSSSRWIRLACVSGSTAGFGSIDIPDRQRQVQQLVYDIVQEASSDFRPTWEREPAP